MINTLEGVKICCPKLKISLVPNSAKMACSRWRGFICLLILCSWPIHLKCHSTQVMTFRPPSDGNTRPPLLRILISWCILMVPPEFLGVHNLANLIRAKFILWFSARYKIVEIFIRLPQICYKLMLLTIHTLFIVKVSTIK
jgi:hypothetical protein